VPFSVSGPGPPERMTADAVETAQRATSAVQMAMRSERGMTFNHDVPRPRMSRASGDFS
jgi:hypothetical protein